MQRSAINPSDIMAISSDDEDAIDYVEEDVVLNKHGIISNDTLIYQQWALTNYLNYSFLRAKANVSNKITVAVIDTGITSHSDLNSVIVSGYDMISDKSNARDGGGRDSDPTDLGDYQGSLDCSGNSSSSWHGTHIAGIIGAVTNNSYGVAGAASNVSILPVRVLGPCGGNTSDIADAIRWAVGGSVSGAGTNSNPAKVVNMSLGGRASCSRYMQEAIDYANAKGAVVVVSAGNESSSVDSMEFTPANCRGVLRVGAIDSSLYQSSYSNYGEIVDISAPGDIIYSSLNSGQNTQSSESFGVMSGTSMAAGFVSAAAAMVFSVNNELTSDQVKDILVRNESVVYCRNYNCSMGSVDPYNAILDAGGEVRDEDFVYSDPVVVGGYTSISSNLYKTNSSGGGLCGTITDISKPRDGGGKFLMSLFLLVGIIISSRLKINLSQKISR